MSRKKQSLLSENYELLILILIGVVLMIAAVVIDNPISDMRTMDQFCENHSMKLASLLHDYACEEYANNTIIQHPIIMRDGQVYWVESK